MRRPLLVLAILAAALVAASATAAIGAPARYVAVRADAPTPVVGAPFQYWVRSSYLVPLSLKAAKADKNALTRRYGPVGSCKFRLTVTVRAVADVDEPAAARVARLLPATGRYLRDEGTHGVAAWRVIRDTGSDTTRGLLARRATGVKTPIAGKPVWLEISAIGRVGRGVTECHSGGPRHVADLFSLMLRTGYLGGFQPTR